MYVKEYKKEVMQDKIKNVWFFSGYTMQVIFVRSKALEWIIW